MNYNFCITQWIILYINIQLYTTGHKCRPYQVIGNVETGLLKWFVLWIPQMHFSGLQAVQNSAARIVTQERLRDHDSMSRALIGLHWLPVDKRIEYKLLLYTYKTLHDLAPGYLYELVVPYVPRRVLRSAELNLLTVPHGKPGKYGSRSFVRASANLWNSLRGEMAAWLKNSPTLEFKRNLKTFLFWERFSS